MEEIYKGFKIVTTDGYGMKEIKSNGRGSVNIKLRGKYTTAGYARAAIDLFLSTKEVSKGAKTE